MKINKDGASAAQAQLDLLIEQGKQVDFSKLLGIYYSQFNEPAINDEVLQDMVAEDLHEHYGYSTTKATIHAQDAATYIVEEMWDTYSSALDYIATKR